MEADSSAKFGKWRSFFWPIHHHELKKFLPLFLMFFLISFNYNALRSYKDTIVVTAPQSGAEALPFIKVWAVLPCAIFFTFLYTYLSNRFHREKVFTIIMSLFLAFFLLFTFVLYPAREYLHPIDLADRLQALLPSGFKGLVAIFRNWTFTLFYVMSELWSTTIFTVLFWGFVNEIASVHEAKRYYGLIGTAGNVAGIFSGQAAIYFSGNFFIPSIPYGKTSWDQSILFLTGALLLSGILTMILFRWLNKNGSLPAEPIKTKQTREEMSLKQSFLYLAKSKYLICIALIVITYNLGMNLVEVVWKNQMNLHYPNPSDYNTYMGKVMTAMAVIATLAGLFTTSNIIRRYSWATCAMIPPIIIGVSGLIFFAVVLFPNQASLLFGMTPLALGVTLGSVQNCLSRASKYTIFDATKEISFIPLAPHARIKGKAAIDGIGSRLGKSGGSLVHQSLLMMFATIANSTPTIAVIFFGVIIAWSYAALSLGKQFDLITTKKGHPDSAPNKDLSTAQA